VQLGLNLGYGATSAVSESLAVAREAERLGFAVVWAAEAYGSDAATVLAWIAAQTESIGVGSAVFQMPARTPAMTAMTAATLDARSDERFTLGLGLSGPQVSEGWHGVAYDAPLARTREYVDIVRKVLRRERLRYDGEHFPLPLPDGPGLALTLAIRPLRAAIPIYLAALGPRNLELAGEIADGALAMFFSPEHAGQWLDPLRAGRAKRGLDLTGFDLALSMPLSIGDDVADAADAVRAYAALYIGGMGSREHNYYNALAGRYGYADAAAVVQERYLARDYEGAMAAVPLEFLDETSLLGPVERVADRLQALLAVGVTTVNVSLFGATVHERIAQLRACAAAFDKAGVGH
jgi:F420-dependent oxidoreductase-like protein